MKNKGMYIEELINKTINYYNINNIGLFEKRNLPIVIKNIKNNYVTGYLKEKSKVDYFGLYNNKHIEFESKQTEKDFFQFSLFKSHQLEYLFKSKQMGAISFLLIHFFTMDVTLAIETTELEFLYKKYKSRKIDYSILKNYSSNVDIIFPGILNLIPFLHKCIEKNQPI